jgi:hypothetical protein
MRPMERARRNKPCAEEHPFAEAGKLFPGEWFDAEDIGFLVAMG